jgi:DNA-binding NtrC family response regulator
MKKILIIDDSVDYLELLKIVLGKKYTVLTIAEVKDLKGLLCDFGPDLVILDHYIGTERSNDIATLLRSSRSGQPIPFLLVSAANNVEQIAAEIGAMGFISKPSSIDHVRKYVDDLFNYRLR